MEVLDVVDENNVLTTRKETKEFVHNNCLWHRIASCWIINKNGEVLLQKRSPKKKRNPNVWSKTGGHVISGESPEDALKREVKEELGISIYDNDMTMVNIYKSQDKKDRYFGYNFIVKANYKLDELTLQEEEVIDVKYITIDELIKVKQNNDSNYSFAKWNDEDFYKDIEIIKQFIKKGF